MLVKVDPTLPWIDAFAGIGGWHLALRKRGITSMSIENWSHARRTLVANHIPVLWDNITTFPLDGVRVGGFVGSPPCQPWSQANGDAQGIDDARGKLVHTFLDLALRLRPRVICAELTPRAQWVFEEVAEALRAEGYNADVRKIDAAHYGLGQARRRVLLAARLDGEVCWPEPTHLDHPVTMAKVLKHRSDLPEWAQNRASTTVVGTFKPEVMAAPGWRKPGDKPRQHTPNSVVTSLEERLLLQGFPKDWKVTGPQSAQDLQVGNALPPLLAGVALAAVGL